MIFLFIGMFNFDHWDVFLKLPMDCELYCHLFSVVDFTKTDALLGKIFLQVLECVGPVHSNFYRFAGRSLTHGFYGGNQRAVRCGSAGIYCDHCNYSSSAAS